MADDKKDLKPEEQTKNDPALLNSRPPARTRRPLKRP